ncbi:MAG: glycosyltransferase family 4 protein [Bacteroidetes bacterium]|nr:glycosyltransferase family 4 protein [Bacteroidota bacterium]
MKRILIHDFGGYGFPVTLSNSLQSRGYTVGHAYCSSLITTPRNVTKTSHDVTLLPIQTKHPLNKYNFIERWKQELEYGHLAQKVILHFNPDIVISANAPLNAQKRIHQTCAKHGIPFIFWLQDRIGLATSQVLKKKIPVFGSGIGVFYQMIEGQLLRKSNAIISITDDFIPYLENLHIAPERYHIIENWGTLSSFHGDPNMWSKQHQLSDLPIFLYAGTLSMKHNPSILLDLSLQLGDQAQVVVVSQGKGADWLKDALKQSPHLNLTVLPYQNPDQLPAMYASADILLVLLTEDASEFSVPSKLLTCLCAGKPILSAIPQNNLATRIINKSGAGFVTDPEDHDRFVDRAQHLLAHPDISNSMSEKAQKWAQENFEINRITDQFETIITLVQS